MRVDNVKYGVVDVGNLGFGLLCSDNLGGLLKVVQPLANLADQVCRALTTSVGLGRRDNLGTCSGLRALLTNLGG